MNNRLDNRSIETEQTSPNAADHPSSDGRRGDHLADGSSLGNGECPSCHTAIELNRDSCRSCGASLHYVCLQCQHAIPIWENTCHECGSEQGQLIAERRKALEQARIDAEASLQVNDFAKATHIAESVAKESDPRLQTQAAWAKPFLGVIEARRAEQLERIASLIREARNHEEACDYESAIRVLEQVPESLQATSIPGEGISVSLLQSVSAKLNECRSLERELRQALASKNISGMLPKLERLSQLKPDRADVKRLIQQLKDRDAQTSIAKDAFQAAQQAMAEHDYETALAQIWRIPPGSRSATVEQLEAQVQTQKDYRDSLASTIQQSVKSKQFAGLLELVEEYLAVAPGDSSMKNLRDKLRIRKSQLSKQLEQVVQQAKSLRQQGEFTAALQCLQAVPDDSQSEEAATLIASTEQLRIEQSRVMASLDRALQTKQYLAAENLSAGYRTRLERCGIQDPKFERQFETMTSQRRIGIVLKRSLLIGIPSGLVLVAIVAVFVVLRSVYQTELDREQTELVREQIVEEQRPASVEVIAEKQRLLEEQRLAEEKLQAEEQRRNEAARLAEEQKRILDSPPITNSIGMKLKLLPPGTFTMGSSSGQDNEAPHPVTLTQAFYLGVTEVTQEQYERVMATNPSEYKEPQKPVEHVSWDDAVEFCRQLSELPEEKAAGRVYRLPTEAEWEYACRAGSTTEYCFGDDFAQLGEYAWFGGGGGKTRPVGRKKPNAWGLFDMHGNVDEWCSDWYAAYPQDAATDPTGPPTGYPQNARVLRGGAYFIAAPGCRSAHRYFHSPSFRTSTGGFRIALSSSGIAAPADSEEGLLAHFRFNGDAKDVNGRNPDFEIKNTEFKDNALFLNGIFEDETNGYLAICKTPLLDYSKYSVAIRFKADEFSRIKSNLITGGRSFRWFGLLWSETGNLVIMLNNANFRQELEGVTLEAGKWTVVSCSVDVPARKVIVVIDGKKSVSIDLPEDFKINVLEYNNHNPPIDDKRWSFTNYGNATVFHGLVDELRLYGRALSQDELKELLLQP